MAARRVLFVDDEPHLLSGLRRMLRGRRDWECTFAENGAEALEQFSAQPFDVVVTDMRMPGMDGAQLLGEVQARFPDAVRIILSGQSDLEAVLRSVGPAHQHLSKPCDSDVLVEAIDRACVLRSRLLNPELQRVLSGLGALPSMPQPYRDLVDELHMAEPSIRRVADIVASDAAMVARILQLVNSAFFGVRQRVTTPFEATQLLGLDTIRRLLLSASAFSQLAQSQPQPQRARAESLWRHSLRVSVYANTVMGMESADREPRELATVVGMLHDIGLLIFETSMPDRFAEIVALAHAEHLTLAEAEMAAFGATHAEAGAYLLDTWGLPNDLVSAVAFHSQPSMYEVDRFGVVSAVHVGAVLAAETDPADILRCLRLDEAHLRRVGMADRLDPWRQSCADAAGSLRME
jgi:HD-like signal output (HDOD) protein